MSGKRDLKVRVLFDCGAHRLFVTKTTKDIAGLNVIRKEYVTITTFGQTEGRPQLTLSYPGRGGKIHPPFFNLHYPKTAKGIKLKLSDFKDTLLRHILQVKPVR